MYSGQLIEAQSITYITLPKLDLCAQYNPFSLLSLSQPLRLEYHPNVVISAIFPIYYTVVTTQQPKWDVGVLLHKTDVISALATLFNPLTLIISWNFALFILYISKLTRTNAELFYIDTYWLYCCCWLYLSVCVILRRFAYIFREPDAPWQETWFELRRAVCSPEHRNAIFSI